MLTLYQFPAPWAVFSASPFCAKLEAFLRWQHIPYQSVIVSRLKQAPMGKVPYISDDNGMMGDSDLIIEYLCKRYKLTADSHLLPEQKAIARAVRYMCEESLYRVMAYMRFVDSEGWARMQTFLFKRYPAIVRWLVAPRIHKYVKMQLTQQGIARHSRDDIIAIARRDLQALSDLLGDKPYLFGDTMTTADLAMFSVVGNFITGPFHHPVRDYALSCAGLAAHVERVRNQCFK